VFDMGDQTEVFYMIKHGELLVEAVVTIDEVNQFPTGLNEWEI
jgi:hypothetical protein